MKKLSLLKLKILWNKYPVINSIWYSKFTNQLMRKGKKEAIEKTLRLTFKQLKSVTTLPYTFFFESFFLTKCTVMLKWIRKGKIFHQVPIFISINQQYRLAMYLFSKFIVSNVRKNRTTMDSKLFSELVNIIFNKTSEVLAYKENQYSVSVYNQALVKFNW